MPAQIRPDDPNLTWQGAISFQRTSDWTMPWRIPYEDIALFPPDAFRERAAMPAGVLTPESPAAAGARLIKRNNIITQQICAFIFKSVFTILVFLESDRTQTCTARGAFSFSNCFTVKLRAAEELGHVFRAELNGPVQRGLAVLKFRVHRRPVGD